MLPDGRSRPNVTWQPASQVGFEAIGVASSRVVAIRAPQMAGGHSGEIRAAHGLSSEVWPRVVRCKIIRTIIRIDDAPPTLFVGAPARTGEEGGRVGRPHSPACDDRRGYSRAMAAQREPQRAALTPLIPRDGPD